MAESGVTQRVAAILAADAAGYSRLMAADEPATIDALDAARAVFIEHIESNHGRVVDTAGDSVLAVFETTEGAAVAAAAIQARLGELNAPVPADRRMPFRIGLHLGDIREKADGTVYGDGVNVAARLEGLAEPGRIVVSGSVHDSIRGRHGLTYHFLGEQAVKNIAEPVRAYLVLAEGETAPAAAGAKRRRLILAGVAVALLALVVAVLWPAEHHESPPEVATAEPEDPILALPSGPSIAVLPFDNMSGDAKEDYFADGITEDIITGLSRFRDLFVIARNSTLQYKGQAVDVRDVGRDLGVRFVLEGSIRRDAENIRVAAQLLDAKSGGHVWAETFDRRISAGSVFAIQDEITEQVVGQIAGMHGAISELQRSEVRSGPPESLGAYECVLLAYEFIRVLSPELHKTARDCLEGAVKTDPNYADAWAWLVYVYNSEIIDANNPLPNSLDRALDAGLKALELDANNQFAHWFLAWNYYLREDLENFAYHADRVLTLNPNNAMMLADLSMPFAWSSEVEKAEGMVRKAMRINPRFPGFYYFTLYHIHAVAGDYQQAAADAEKLATPDLFWMPAKAATAYGHLGRTEDARAAIERLLVLYPNFAENARQELEGLYWPDPEYVDRYMAGLEKAGLFDEPETPTRPVIAVLPFDSMSGDADHQFFADGIAEDIITRLARFSDIGVIARNSSFQYKGENVDVRNVADELGATYVLEGSVRRSENDIRVIAQLIDATDGTHLWAETYDRDLSAASIFAVQDDITQRVVGAIASSDSVIAIAVVNASEMKAPAELESYECVLRAGEFWRIVTPEAHLRVRNCLEEVIRTEPDYAQAFAFLAHITIDEFLYGFNVRSDTEPALDRALAYAHQAIELGPKSAWAHWALGRAAYYRHEMGVFRTEAERIIELAPNDSFMLAAAGHTLAFSGSWESGMSLMARAIELNPHHQTWYHIPYFYDAYRQGLDDDALAAALRINMPGFYWQYVLLTAAYGQLGMEDEAAASIARLHELYPGYSIQSQINEQRLWNFEDDMITRMADGLRKAGLPEGTD